ncbi:MULTISPECIES: hypothetical protein [unclassified Leucobacter]|uniref:hypothetical protein n=1 Tax=unclassified Leucobacter TaxID=2621730 RepID=UPI00165EA3FB|nr:MULTISPECIES: hypothetical protein [unclassified Leucobacter]MBC9926189.1 hypothetical protein [Leucobacter sp. cx-169]
MKTNPYYSTNTQDPDVHHNQRDCPAGKAIPKENKKFGTNGYKLCKTCAKM